MTLHETWLARVLAAVIILVAVLGVLYGYAAHCGIWNGLYFSDVTVTTVGYGDITPHGWAPHLITVALMDLAIPLWSGSFALLATALTTRHVDRRHADLKKHITEEADRGR